MIEHCVTGAASYENFVEVDTEFFCREVGFLPIFNGRAKHASHVMDEIGNAQTVGIKGCFF